MATSVQELNVSERRLGEILETANAWALCHGVSMRPSKGDEKEKGIAVCAPYALFPSLVPAPILHQAKSTMIHFNRLMHKVAMDDDFLSNSLKNVVEVDPFMAGLWKVYLKVKEMGTKQSVMVGLFRNDFMMDCRDSLETGQVARPDQVQLKQIEFNSIAASFGGLAQQIVNLQRMTLGLCGKSYKDEEMPQNKPASGLSRGILRAWEIYNKSQAVVIVLVGDAEKNAIDQQWMELRLHEQNPRVRVLRKTFSDFHQSGRLDDDKKLFVGDDEVAVVYLRHGYTVDHYPTDLEWDARLLIEQSSAIKCPSVQYQLMGSKKIQQELARPGALEKYISDSNIVNSIRATFADQYSLDLGPEGDNAVELALKSPEKFVLKPQREGGGNNLYNEEITKFLTKNKASKERNAYILMQRIFPWQQRNYLVKTGVPFVLSDVVSELGIYGVYIGSMNDEIENYECGHMMRTKTTSTDEGGIVAGFAVLDTPLIY